MSWAEVSKINNDFTEPLNYLAYIQDLAMFGKKGYVYKSEDMLTQLSTSKNATTHQIAKTLLLQGIIENGFDVGKYFAKIIPSSDPVFDNLPTIDDIVDDETAMTAVANSETAMTAVANSETAMTAVINSETAMTAVANSETAMTAVANSETAMTAVINSETAMTAVINSETAMTAVANSETAMTAVANSETAMTAVYANPQSLTYFFSSPYTDDLIWSDVTQVTRFYNAGTTSAATYLSNGYENKGKSIRVGHKGTSPSGRWISPMFDMTNVKEIKFKTKNETTSPSVSWKISFEGSDIMNGTGNDSWTDKTIDLSSKTGEGKFSFYEWYQHTAEYYQYWWGLKFVLND